MGKPLGTKHHSLDVIREVRRLAEVEGQKVRPIATAMGINYGQAHGLVRRYCRLPQRLLPAAQGAGGANNLPGEG